MHLVRAYAAGGEIGDSIVSDGRDVQPSCEGKISMATGFSVNNGFGRPQSDRAVRAAVVAGFVALVVLAVGIPLLSKPKTVVAPEALPTPTAIPEVDVFMPLQRVAVGAALTPSLFRRERMSVMTVNGLGGQVVRSEAEFGGRFARSVILPGRPLMADQLMDSPENIVLRKIAPGYRAVTIKVDDVTGIEGWGMPGARVDVLWYTDAPSSLKGIGTGREPMVTTIVRNAQVLSVMGRADTTGNLSGVSDVADRVGQGAAKGVEQVVVPQQQQQNEAGMAQIQVMSSFTVTVAVSPADGQRLFLASTTGRLSLMLRGEFETGSDASDRVAVYQKHLYEGAGVVEGLDVEGNVRVRRDDGTYDEWSIVDNKVRRWDRGE
jgi:Flp pilus assembly protein CpaB